MNRLLVIGLSGQVGIALRTKLAERGIPVLALSRDAHPDEGQVRWLRGQLPDLPAVPDGIDTILAAGPLDVFADWFAAKGSSGIRVVALGSTSIHSKSDSPDAGERDVARRLAAAEEILFAAGRRTGSAVTVLRPTLIYGEGNDRSLSALADFARRWGWAVVPGQGTGLRQPVHVGDVAEAMLRCLDRPGTGGHSYDLPGGERLAASAMFERSLRRRAPGCRILHLPGWLFRFCVSAAGRFGWLPVSSAGFLARLGRDQVADTDPVEKALGLTLRAFQP